MHTLWLCLSLSKDKGFCLLRGILNKWLTSLLLDRKEMSETLNCVLVYVSHAHYDVIVYFGVGIRTRRRNELDKTTSMVLAASFCFLSVCCCCLWLFLHSLFILCIPSTASPTYRSSPTNFGSIQFYLYIAPNRNNICLEALLKTVLFFSLWTLC